MAAQNESDHTPTVKVDRGRESTHRLVMIHFVSSTSIQYRALKVLPNHDNQDMAVKRGIAIAKINSVFTKSSGI